MKARAFLFGPFVGELCWEFYRFAPFAIYLKKHNPGARIIVLTRPSRFDLYGQYVDIFVPLRLKNDSVLEENGFKLAGYKEENYYTIVKYFRKKFNKRFNVISHEYPDVRIWRYKVKWQFPRDKMDYDFKPRKANKELADRYIKPHHVFIDHSSKYVPPIRLDNYETKHCGDLAAQVTNFVDDIKTTTLGCFIEALKTSLVVVGNLASDNSRLALLLGKPLITLNEQLTDDAIHLINPRNTPVIRCNNIKEGLKIYEDYF